MVNDLDTKVGCLWKFLKMTLDGAKVLNAAGLELGRHE